MAGPLVSALALTLACQSPAASERSLAEDLARSGRTVEAIRLFERIVEQDPGDIDAALWIARLDLRLGRTEKAEAGFRAVLRDHPADVDARIGLGATLTRRGRWSDALAVLRETEPDAGENADLLGALARAYRRAGDDRAALGYYSRAKALAPTDPDLVSGFEATARAYGHSVAFEGFGEHASTQTNTASGALALDMRATPQLHFLASARIQQRSGSSDTTAGGGFRWRVGRATTTEMRAVVGSANTALPDTDLSTELRHYAGIFEVGGGIRILSFAGANVVAGSPVLSWDRGTRWRLDGRYTYSRSSFDATGESSSDHSVFMRGTWRGWRRVALNAAYAYGIESFEDLTADRLDALGATTVAAGLRISTPSLTVVTSTWEHQWRSNGTAIDRLTLSIVQSFP